MMLPRRSLWFAFAIAVAACTGCALVPSADDVHNAAVTVKDTVSGKAARDRRNQTFAEARILERRKDFAGAEKLYRELLADQPHNRDCLHRLAVMASLQGKYDEAGRLYREAVSGDAPTADLWNDAGYCHYLQHQLPEAESALRSALALQPQHRSAMNNLAMVVGEAGRLDEAYALFRQAGDEADAEANFAYLLAQCGDFSRAQQHYSRALSLKPEMRPALDGLLQVTQRMQETQLRQEAQAGAAANPGNGEVQQASHQAPLDAQSPQAPPQRPLIEVYSGGPRRYAPPTPPSAAAVPSAVAPGAPQPTSAPTVQQPVPAGQAPWSAGSGTTPLSGYTQQASPAYLQPTAAPRSAPGPQGAPAQAPGGAGGVPYAGGPFPPLVGGASAVR